MNKFTESFRWIRRCIGYLVMPVIVTCVSAQGNRWDRNVATAEEAQAQTDSALGMLNPYLNEIGYAYLEERKKAIAEIDSREGAIARQEFVKEKILELVGGLPPMKGPVRVKKFDSLEERGFRVENIAYESSPNYWVTANVYVPIGDGPFPSVVMWPGHGSGKSSNFAWAAYLARTGILVLSIDPLGQGERILHFDTDLGDSKIERMGEHEHSNQSALLVGQHISRYWFADGIRGVDYLIERGDVLADRIGVFGCSGGGTAAAYLAAMDERISVAAVSSYITSFRALLPGNGPQDAEQTLPGFIANGLDFADWIELAAPRPYAVVAFEKDFFPISGAKHSFEEAKNFYSHFSAIDEIEFISGTGGHCSLSEVSPAVLSFLVYHLQGEGATVPEFEYMRPIEWDELIVTPTGQVSTSIGGEDAETIAQRAYSESGYRRVVLESEESVNEHRTQLETSIRTQASVEATPGQSVGGNSSLLRRENGYRLESVEIVSEPGITLFGILGLPESVPIESARLWMEAKPLERLTREEEFVRLVRSGVVVLLLHPRGVLGEPTPDFEKFALGPYMQPLLRSVVVGKSLVGMRVDDTIRSVDWLLAKVELGADNFELYGRGELGMVALHAAAIDTRISRVRVEESLVSYRMALNSGLHRNLSENLIPDVLNFYDTVGLLQAISPRPVVLDRPVNALGRLLRRKDVLAELNVAFETDRMLGQEGRIQLIYSD